MLDCPSNWQPEKNGPLSHLNGFHVFPRDNIRKTFSVMHYSVFEQIDRYFIILQIWRAQYKHIYNIQKKRTKTKTI